MRRALASSNALMPTYQRRPTPLMRSTRWASVMMSAVSGHFSNPLRRRLAPNARAGEAAAVNHDLQLPKHAAITIKRRSQPICA
jgi:hypothetical protein